MLVWSLLGIIAGAHIPALNSDVEFLDILCLGIFVILSPAFDRRFYPKPPPSLVKEAAYAVLQFHSLIHIFSLRFIILLEGVTVVASYVVDRMLAEFASAAVVLAKDVQGFEDEDDVGGPSISTFRGRIEGILRDSYPQTFPYYMRCLDSGHKHFTWTGPRIQILPQSEDCERLISFSTMGELQDLPGCQIYPLELDDDVDMSPATVAQVGKRHDRGNSLDLAEERPRKRKC